MKALWFTNIPMPAMDRRMGTTTQGSGYWMVSLLNALSQADGITLGVVTAWPGAGDLRFEEDGIAYFVIGQPRGTSHLDDRAKDLKKCLEIIGDWQPDIVHVHGTERFYGRLAGEASLTAPVAISIQGLLTQIVPRFFGNMALFDIVNSHRPSQFIRGYGLLHEYLRVKKASRREAAIIRSAGAFLGRTRWDHAHVAALNPGAQYYQVNETMRSDFHESQWDLSHVERHSIIFTNARNPLRNIETVLEAMRILDGRYKDVSLRLAGSSDPGSGYGKHLRRLIGKHSMEGRVRMLGYIDERTMVDSMLRSHVFCNASLVENSPNSLCEAQLLGMPCVGSFTGGIPSLINDGSTGLLFPATDASLLADSLSRIFADDSLARSLGRAARQAAKERHDPDAVVRQLLSAYIEIKQDHADSSRAHHAA